MNEDDQLRRERVLMEVRTAMTQMHAASIGVHMIDQRRTRGALRTSVREARVLARALEAALQRLGDGLLPLPRILPVALGGARRRPDTRPPVSEAEAGRDLARFLLEHFPQLLQPSSVREASRGDGVE